MELLIVGASSYIGGEVYKEAKKRNLRVIGTKNHSNAENMLKYDITVDDIEDVAINLKGDKKYALICSAIPQIDVCYKDYERAYNVNVTSTIRLLKILNKMEFKSVFLSTDFVFSGKDGYYSENEIPEANTKYGSMKIEVENYIKEFLKEDCIMRISKIVGDKPHYRNVFTEWFDLAKKGNPIRCIKDNIFSPTDINDIVNCFFVILENELKGLYHTCNGEHFERNELARQFIRHMGLDVEIQTLPVEEFGFKDSRSLRSYMSNDKFVKETGYRFRSMKEIIERYKRNLDN